MNKYIVDNEHINSLFLYISILPFILDTLINVVGQVEHGVKEN